jgi:hypothetical protein
MRYRVRLLRVISHEHEVDVEADSEEAAKHLALEGVISLCWSQRNSAEYDTLWVKELPKTKKLPCSGPQCSERRIHYERPDEPRGIQYVEVPEDFTGKAYCSHTCAMLDGALKLKT